MRVNGLECLIGYALRVACPCSGRSGLTSRPVIIIGRRQGLVLGRKSIEHAEKRQQGLLGSWKAALPSWSFQAMTRGVLLTFYQTGCSTSLDSIPHLKSSYLSLEVETTSFCPPCPQINRDTLEDPVGVL